MKRLNLIVAIWFVTIRSLAQPQTDQYQYRIDLLNIQHDQVSVSFSPPRNTLKTGRFVLPKLVPGYYDALNFGQYISNFQAIDKNGRNIAVDRLDTNTWQVLDLMNTVRISYQVSDGWEHLLQNTGEPSRLPVCFGRIV